MIRQATKPGPQRQPAGHRALDTLEEICHFPRFQRIEGGLSAEEQGAQKRAARKHQTYPVVTSLAQYGKETGSPLEAAYRDSIYCASLIVQEDGRLRSSYCNRKWCLVCNSIRTAKLIDQYAPVIGSWEDPHFVTLTVRNVQGGRLPDTLAAMQSEYTKVRRYLKRQYGMTVTGVRKTECTFSTTRGDFHPHYHVIVDGADTGHAIKDRWLDRHRSSANEAGQDIRPADKRSVTELFKYQTKLVTKSRDGNKYPVPPAALDTIFRALHGKHAISPTGFKLPAVIEADDELDLEGSQEWKRHGEQLIWQWVQTCTDWIDLSTGDTFSGYVPSD